MYTPHEFGEVFAREEPWEKVFMDLEKHDAGVSKDLLRRLLHCPGAKRRDIPSYLVNKNLANALEKHPPYRIPIVWDRPGNHKDLVCVLFLDRHVEPVSKDEFEQVLRTIKDG